jgi:glycosyltransferase involved in cell wall biosynthesis
VRISVIVPCVNESAFVRAFLESVRAQRDVPGTLEVLVVDGMSDDGTRTTLAEFQSRGAITVLDNPARTVSAALNLGLAASTGDVVVRMDVHTTYADDYIGAAVDLLERSGADNVGGPWVAAGCSVRQRAIAAALSSLFGVGTNRGHNAAYEGEVDTVYLGTWRRRTLVDLGGFDETLVRNQDDELNFRIQLRGGRIWQSPRVRSWYAPRRSLTALFRQYLQYGFWKVPILLKHGRPASWRHVVPAAFILANGVMLIAACVYLITGWQTIGPLVGLWAAILAVYAFAVCAASIGAAARHGWALVAVLPLVFLTLHAAYGLGFLLGALWWGLLRHQRAPERLKVLTR